MKLVGVVFLGSWISLFFGVNVKMWLVYIVMWVCLSSFLGFLVVLRILIRLWI